VKPTLVQSLHTSHTLPVATRPCQTIRDGVEGEGLCVLESRRSRMTCGTWSWLMICVHKVSEGLMYGLARRGSAKQVLWDWR